MLLLIAYGTGSWCKIMSQYAILALNLVQTYKLCYGPRTAQVDTMVLLKIKQHSINPCHAEYFMYYTPPKLLSH